MFTTQNRERLPWAIADEFEQLSLDLTSYLLTEHHDDGTHNFIPTGYDLVPIGSIIVWGLATAPTRWVLCNGAAINRVKYVLLFQKIGTTFGVGDGSTTFNVPNLAAPAGTVYIILAGV